MSHLISISIGPVQDFIAAARRTNDLYAGSKLLQEVVAAAAKVVSEAGGDLIFPADPDTGGSNKILAYLPNGDPRSVCQKAETAAKKTLAEKWKRFLLTYGDKVSEGLGDQQIASFLEFFAAWQPWGRDDESYADARRKVERLLAGRKALRDFVQPGKHSVPKSPLDPSRDTVLKGRPTDSLTQSPLWLKPNELLDAISLIKRLENSALETVPSTVDIAANDFLAGDPEFKKWIRGQNLANNQPMPSGVVHRSRRDELKEEGKLSAEQYQEIVERLGKREPTPYFAILVADGDKMGAKIAEIGTLGNHQSFSKKVGEFANGTRTIVNQHDGHLVFAGGDDVLAFLPLHKCVACAAKLAESFHKKTEMSMTIALAIVHYHEPLYLTLDTARRAERTAKTHGRNRLRVEWHTRGGQTRTAEYDWVKGFELKEWEAWQEAFKNGLPRGLAHELAMLGREAERAGLSSETVRAEANRIFARKEWDGKPTGDPTSFGPWQNALAGISCGQDLIKLSDLLILMEGLARTTTQVEANV